MRSKLCPFGLTALFAGAYISHIPSSKDVETRKTVIVTSANKEKLRAVDRAFKEYYKNSDIEYEIIGRKSDSGIYHGQPWGLQHTFEGAMTRIHSLKNKIKMDETTSHIVSVENGVETLLQHDKTIGIDFACAVINQLEEREEEQMYVAFSQGRPYPLEAIQAMKRNGASNDDIGKLCSEYYKNSPLSISREDQVYQATLMALTQSS